MAVRQKETHKNIGRDNYRQNDGETFRNSAKQTEWHSDKETDIQTNTNKQLDK